MELPKSVPQMKRDELLAKVKAAVGDIDRKKHPILIVGVRGYYRDTFGEKDKNDIGMYDDAIFVDSPNLYASYNANTDPSKQRIGMANLKPGLYFAHRLGLHKGKYLALIQTGGEVTVARYQSEKEFTEDTGHFGINIHKGGINTTSSEGCQTIHPSQYESFIGNVKSEVVRIFTKQMYDKTTIPYVLLDFDEQPAV